VARAVRTGKDWNCERIPNRGAIVRDLKPREVRVDLRRGEELEVLAVRILRVNPWRLIASPG
jgi:hypothetical protein